MIVFTPPTARGFVMSGWGRPRAYRNGWHEGLDFPSAKGSPVLAAATGIVSRVDNYNNSFAGNWIAIDHGNGMYSRYMHNTKNLVSKGDKVRQGQQIGTVGTTGTKNTGPHVHFDVKFKDGAHAAYKAAYGTPTTGWGSKSSLGHGVPGETFMSKATYSDASRKWAEDHGVVFYAGVSTIALLGFAGAGYLFYRALK